MKRVINIISEIDKSWHFEWLTLQLKDQFDYQTILIGIKNSQHQLFLKRNGLTVYEVEYLSKKDFVKAWWRVLMILARQRPAIIHTHFWVAHLIGISAAWILRIPKRVMTRHHAEYHHNSFPKGVMLDKLLNRAANLIVAPTQNVKDIIVKMEKGDPRKVHVIQHGLDIASLTTLDPQRSADLQRRYQLDKDCYPVIGVISRYFELKGIHFIIPAFKKLLVEYPRACLVLANANGDFTWKIRELLKDIDPQHYREIVYENDTAALYKQFDVFVHVPVSKNSESFGLVYIEALAVGIPSVFTLSGIACDFIKDGCNALVVPYKSEEDILKKMRVILQNTELAEKLKSTGKDSVKSFTMENMGSKVANLYLTD